ncbi:MAG TPA: siroheme synthase, partial [Phenylobacterium sp.]|nr:siroheme synthase [Phenylobacterium sp.]
QVLSMARRDAERLDPAEATDAHLAELARSGLRIVRVVPAARLDAEALRLIGLGVAVEVLAAAPGP